MKRLNTAERVSHRDPSDNFVYQRSLLAYREAASRVSGNILEIGTGSGYGVELISPYASTFVTVDKHQPNLDFGEYGNVNFQQMRVPPIDYPSNTFDWVISFQVIEHIKDDFAFLAEVNRVLKHGGKFMITTPNSRMSLTRNPWHVREYTPGEFTNLMECHFDNVEGLGIFGNSRVMDYYEKNRRNVERVACLDPLKLQQWLPRWMLRIPYDVANRINRRRLLKDNKELTAGITIDDYRLAPVGDQAFDLFYMGEKN